jgi:tetratricopeptide (TPR) repeat protein
MKYPSRSLLWHISISLVLVAGFSAWPRVSFAQDYSQEEYKAYQDITAETDGAKKVALVVKFFREYPKTTLRPHVHSAYAAVMSAYQKAGNWSQVIHLGEEYLSVVPDDQFTLSLVTSGYQQTKAYPKFVAFGEKVYAKNPSGNLAYYLAKAYQEMGNDAKFLAWGEKTVAAMPDNHEILVELAKKFGMAKRNAEAAKYANMCVKAVNSATKPADTADNLWKQYTSNTLATCYAIAGNVAYERRDYANAIQNLENSVRNYKRNDLAYYYLGLSYWQTNKIDIAMLNLAKAYLLKGQASASAKQHLDNLYKSTHGQSLVGQDKVLARATQDLK